MSHTPEELLILTAQFEKLATDEQEVDVPQPSTFEQDYVKWLKRTDKPAPSTKREMKAVRLPPVVEKLVEKYEDSSNDDYDLADDVKIAKDKKLDPKAKVRNRGTVCVPAEQAKDKKDHFPINDEGQARSALSRIEGLTSAPWYKGSLEGLRALVKRKVHSKFPNIGKDKKASLDSINSIANKFVKQAEVAQFVGNHINMSDLFR